MQFQHTIVARPHERFASTVFDGQIGKTVNVNFQTETSVVSSFPATLTDSQVSDDGKEVTLSFKSDFELPWRMPKS